MTRQELVELVAKIVSANGSEAEIAEWLQTLEANVPDPAVSDLIYWAEREMTADEIVDRARAYEVVALPPPGESHLLWAVRTGNVAAARALLADGADANERGSDGRTPLQVAGENGREELLELLRQAGAAE